MSIYKRFCVEETDSAGALLKFSLRFPDNFNFGYDVVDAIAQDEPGRRAVVWCDMAENTLTYSFRDISEMSSKAASALMSAGIGKGDRVMVALKRQPEYWFIIPALHKMGAVAVSVTHMLTANDFKYRMDYASVKAIICAPETELMQKVREASESALIKPMLFCVGCQGDGFADLNMAIAKASAQLQRQDTSAGEPILMYFTSGTTGYPKAVIHDHTYPLAHIITAKYWQQVEDGGLHFTVAETGWAKAAWGKMYGQWLCGSAVMVYDFDNFDPKQLTTIISRFSVTSFCAPPTVFRYLVKKGMNDMPALRHASTAGETLSPEIFNRFFEKTGLELMEGFGQTESTLILANLKGVPSKPGSLGKPSPLYHVELLKDDGSFAKNGELGEIVVIPPEDGKQYGIFTSYYSDEALYKYVWRNGFFHTGDIAYRDDEGFYWFHGRIDDVIKSGGYRIGPYEIEDVLIKHDAVLECAVVGVKDTLRGQAIKSFVVLSSGQAATVELQKELREFCNSRLAEYKWLRTIEFVEQLPKTISGKIRKNVLRDS